MNAILDLLLEPSKAFASRRARRPSPLAGFLVAALAFGPLTLAKELALRNLPPEARSLVPLPAWLVALAAGFFGALLLWGALTAGLTLATGDSARTAELVGLAHLPLALAGLFELALAAWLPVAAALPPRPEAPTERLLWSAKALLEAQKAPFFRLAAVPELAGVLWGGFLFHAGARVFFPRRAGPATAAFLTVLLGLWFLRHPFVLPALR